MKIKLKDTTIQYLCDLITGDSQKTRYRSGPELVKFFNQLHEKEVNAYRRGFPSRNVFVKEELDKINNSALMRDCILKTFDPILFIEREEELSNLIQSFNKYLAFDEYELKKNSREILVQKLHSNQVINTTINIDNEFIHEHILKSKENIENGKFSEAITEARSLIEAVLLYLYKVIKNEEIQYYGDLTKLDKTVKKLLSMDLPDDADDCLKQITRGFSSIILGLAGLRNKTSNSHGKINTAYRPSKHHAILAVNAARTLSQFYYDSYTKNHKQTTPQMSVDLT